MTLAFISHKDCELHDMGYGHPEQPARVKVIEEIVRNSNLPIEYFEAPLATREQLIEVHDEDYIDYIFKVSPKSGLVSLDPDTFMNPFTLNAALRSAGAAILAVDLVMQNKFSAAFCNVRPPGHHAEKNHAMGFCFFNNVAVGVAHVLLQYRLKKIAIIDFDVHHGNGTEDIFRNDERVLLCSSFEHPFYPHSGFNTKSDHIINLPLPPGTDGKMFRNNIENTWLNALDKFKPDMIFFSAGFDAHREDTLADFNLIESDYAWITNQIKQVANQHCPGRIVSLLEGGYALPALARSVLSHLEKLT